MQPLGTQMYLVMGERRGMFATSGDLRSDSELATLCFRERVFCCDSGLDDVRTLFCEGSD